MEITRRPVAVRILARKPEVLFCLRFVPRSVRFVIFFLPFYPCGLRQVPTPQNLDAVFHVSTKNEGVKVPIRQKLLEAKLR